ncbi:MAG: leucyl aminopeptidase [Acidimicrobiia bacterium]
MSVSCSISSRPVSEVDADLVVVPVFTERVLGPGGDAVADAFHGDLVDFMTTAGFAGKVGDALVVPVAGMRAATALLVGVGAADDVTPAVLRRAAGGAARRARTAAKVATTLADAHADPDHHDEAVAAVAEGFALGAYQFLSHKSKGKPTALRSVTIVGSTGARATKAIDEAAAVVTAVAWARDMVNEPSGTKAPADFAAAARKFLTGKGVKVTVLTEPQLRAQKMGGVLGVGQGSAQPPRFVKAVYEPTGAKARGTLALVGKGVTFDTGGISIKPSDGMETMKTDMGGAAAVLAAMGTLQALGVRHRVVAYAPMAENMPSGTAIRPGDVLKMRDGQTVEVLNTDAEGRLILADALSWAVDEKADAIIDLATLTGACVVALGEKVAGLMGNDDTWSGQVRDAADRAGEPVWPLPLPDDYRELLDSDVADLRNISTGRYGGALTAGIFLEAFVQDVPWVHLDIAGPARAPSDHGEMTKGGTGFGVRTLVEVVRAFAPPTPRTKPGRSGSKKSAAKKSAAKKAGSKRAAG